MLFGARGRRGDSPRRTRRSCTAGVHPYGGANARTFCGPAKATVVVGGRTIHYAGGNCERGAAYVSLNIGTVVLGTSTKPKPEYFGLLVGKAPIVGGTPATHDGTFVPEALVADHAGKGYAMTQAKVKLAGNRTGARSPRRCSAAATRAAPSTAEPV